MQAPNGQTSICENCKLKESGFLCHLTAAAAKEFQSIKIPTSYPAGARLFLENEPAKGIYLLCSGKVKLSVSSKGGKTLILQLARPGEILGLSAAMSGIPYEVSAETLYPSQISFIRREDFISFIGRFPEAYQAVIRQLNSQYAGACEQLRTVGLSTNAHEKIARLFLQWSSDEKQTSQPDEYQNAFDTRADRRVCRFHPRNSYPHIKRVQEQAPGYVPRNNRNDPQPRSTDGDQWGLTQRMIYRRSIPLLLWIWSIPAAGMAFEWPTTVQIERRLSL